MNRRTVLKRGSLGLAGVVALSGCTETTLQQAEAKPPFVDVDEAELELPVRQQTDAVEGGVLRAESYEVADQEAFEAYLDDEGLPVETLQLVEKVVEAKPETPPEGPERPVTGPPEVGSVLELEFVQSESRRAGFLQSVGVVAGGYAALVAAAFDAEMLEATVLDAGHYAYGTFDVHTAWAESYNEGLTSARAYGAKPWHTVQSL